MFLKVVHGSNPEATESAGLSCGRFKEVHPHTHTQPPTHARTHARTHTHLIRVGKPRTATSTFTQLLSSDLTAQKV